jgi:hypothetical protein
MNVETNTIVRWTAAALTLAGGLVHLKLWDGMKDWPNDNLARMFLLNVVASVVAAAALAVWDHWLPVVGALAVVNGTLFAFGISRTDRGVPFTDVEGLGKFTEAGFDPSPEAALALIAEVGAAALLVVALSFTPNLPSVWRGASPQKTLG